MADTEIKKPDIPLPLAMEHLSLTPNGYRKPWFVKGSDLRITNQKKYLKCMEGKKTCWICGNANRKEHVFITDIRAAMSSRSLEPASHAECTFYAIKVCPFLLLPQFKRRPNTLPTEYQEQATDAISGENPGYFAITSVKKFAYGAPVPGVATRFAYWKKEHVLKQSVWSKGEMLVENESGQLEPSILAKYLTLS
ncbi:MAG: hypothetical protein JJ934_17995 [Pseudomonadales bacterium]|nr:hypothetical protein [Pseudomonadales bacterium]